ncbi:DNA-directed RNA polymerase subunit beta [Corynebacterium kutscheri]|uniref:DNA-directed RNA polymerase subunit beta n=1 Tax=Corynebacterium kutscheri TaxID=35755 RepID=A0A0F6TDV0_9CORY|nr:M23 family metallopeptidase [Corynebacterium kutscheri]AKE41856.1 Peptidase family M23 [Corynebacterium kutscheri]VEH04360.1 DNA-directed RNA polymerase subunit beta [Corynebacterium kutscheri]VEH10184.1 DNA-directed RNA polymerase subunit beta [Corynebacterium kutscheri]VEH80266.1 DNA-directed RNA polymerase subunit beta [Corynebacterium kutscheri]
MEQAHRVAGGKHRKASPVKGRVAFVAVATGAVSTAGATGAALAYTSSDDSTQIHLTSNETAALSSEDAPQVLAISEFKPNINLGEQLVKAVNYSEVRALADELARKPKVTVSRPAEGAFTSGFGPRWGTFHAGVDIANVTNTPILAVMDGVVIDSGPASGYGNWIRIRHEDGSVSVYGHMETLNVSVGQQVTAGQHIAGMGSRGFSTGTHLHFEIHPDGTTATDPAVWLAERGIVL